MPRSPAEARTALACSPLDSLDAEVDANAEEAWRAEINSRLQEIDRGTRLDQFWITLTGRSITMQITSKGQVTIPQEIRNQLGLLPHTKVEFELAGDHARIRKARRAPGEGFRGRLALDALRGTADTRMSTDEILALTRAEVRHKARRSK
jgi:AbrB family looped-hinge helix DNA binding protein